MSAEIGSDYILIFDHGGMTVIPNDVNNQTREIFLWGKLKKHIDNTMQ